MNYRGLVEELRCSSEWFCEDPDSSIIYIASAPFEAADRIEALEAENEQMVRFIRGLDCECDEYHGHRCNRCATLAALGEK